MKKLLSILTITTMTTSIPAPLLAVTTQEQAKRDVVTTEKDVTTGFNIKIKEKWNWQQVKTQDKPFNEVDNKWYIVVWKGNNQWNINKFKNDEFPKQIIRYNGKDRIIINYGNFTGRQKLKDLYFIYRDSLTVKYWSEDDGTYFKSVYRWDGVGEPNLSKINPNTGKITDWKQPTKNYFQQGILFSLADGSKTASWSNDGMRLTVDGETNININNPNVTDVYWNDVLQLQSSRQWKINVKTETTAKDHKLVIKYNINGTKYTSEDITVSMLAKIDPPKPFVKKQLSELIKKTDLGNIGDNNDDTIFLAVNKTNNSIIDDFTQIEIIEKTDTQATLKALDGCKSYQGSAVVKYNISSATTVDLKIDLTSPASGAQIDKDYLAQPDNTKMTNKVDTFYYVSSESTLTMIKPTANSVITGVLYGCDDKWEKNGQQKNIDVNNGIKLDGSQLGASEGKYLIELKNELNQTNKIYLQISSDKEIKHYWNTDNGKQFERWANDNGYDNIRGYSASQLNNLFELSKTWKQSLKHLDLKLDNFVVYNIKNFTQDEIDNYKTKIIASVKAQVEKYAPNVVENTDYKILVDNLVAGDWTSGKDVKVQAVDGSTKLLSFTAKTIPFQQKEQPTPPTPDNNKKSGLSGWTIFGIVVGSLTGLFLFGWLLKKFVVNPFILEPIRKKKAKVFAEKTAKDIAQMKLDDEEWEAKRRGDK